jgi:hypothetical protein
MFQHVVDESQGCKNEPGFCVSDRLFNSHRHLLPRISKLRQPSEVPIQNLTPSISWVTGRHFCLIFRSIFCSFNLPRITSCRRASIYTSPALCVLILEIVCYLEAWQTKIAVGAWTAHTITEGVTIYSLLEHQASPA